MPHVNPVHAEITPLMHYNPILIDQNSYIPTIEKFAVKENQKTILSSEDTLNIEQDYIDLFSYNRKGHMAKYVHMYRPDTYDKAITQDAYYPFKMECELLMKKADEIVKLFQGVTEAIEIGPGSRTPVMFKTIPLLRALERQSEFSTYKAMDSNLEYANQACKIIKKNFENIKIEAIEIDFLSEKRVKNIRKNLGFLGKKVFFSFGQSIFSSNNDKNSAKFLNNIGMLLRNGDYLLFGIDVNRDETMLEAAYNQKIVHALLLNVMYYLKNKLNIEGFNPEAFESIYKWNHAEYTVEHYLKPTINQVLNIGNIALNIGKGNQFNIMSSRKLDINKIEKLLNKEEFVIKDVVSIDDNQENKISIVIAQKINHYY